MGAEAGEIAALAIWVGSRIRLDPFRKPHAERIAMYNRQRLIELFQQRALKFGEFRLASGNTSNYYLDGKQVTLHAEGLRLVSEGVLSLLDGVACDAVGGMSIGADPIIGGVLATAAVQGRDLKGFLVRKEAKGHGTKKFLEGPVEPGQKVIIIDDVITTGGSSIQAIERAGNSAAK